MKKEKVQMMHRDSWVTYRPSIKVLDCTVRDGGLMNDHKFDLEFVRACYETCCAAGVDYMEMGYKADRSLYNADENGPWRFCGEDDLRRVIGDAPPGVKLSAMADVGRTNYREDIQPKEQSALDCIRVACYIHQIPGAIDMIKDAHDKGYETTLNLMALSAVPEHELRIALEEVVEKSPVNVLYVVDSFGALYSEQIRDYVKLFVRAAGPGRQVGIHTHNNMQLAYANTIEALIAGANRLDVTINGLGRGAGNCPMELLLSFLKNPKFNVRPVLECIEKHFFPLRKTIPWGYSIPHMVSGMLNQHPRESIAWMESEHPDAIVDFYDKMIE